MVMHFNSTKERLHFLRTKQTEVKPKEVKAEDKPKKKKTTKKK